MTYRHRSPALTSTNVMINRPLTGSDDPAPALGSISLSRDAVIPPPPPTTKKYQPFAYTDDKYFESVMRSDGALLAVNFKLPVQFGGAPPFGLIHSPTGNCQICSIFCINAFLYYSNVLEIVKMLHRKCGKNMLLIDIERHNVNRAIEVFGEDNIISNTPYISTRDSHMNIILIDMIKLGFASND